MTGKIISMVTVQASVPAIDGNMSGSITIDENAKVNAFSQEDGAGIGSGEDGNMSGSITISGNAQVTAGSGWDGAGIGAGESA